MHPVTWRRKSDRSHSTYGGYSGYSIRETGYSYCQCRHNIIWRFLYLQTSRLSKSYAGEFKWKLFPDAGCGKANETSAVRRITVNDFFCYRTSGTQEPGCLWYE